MKAQRRPYMKFWTILTIAALMIGMSSCGGGKKEEQGTGKPGGAPGTSGEASISGTITLDPALKDKVGKEPLLMIMASMSPEPNKPAVIVKRVAEASFPYGYKLTAEDITLAGSSFQGKMYVSARIDPAGMVGAPQPGTFEGVYPGNPVPVGSSKIDIVINKAY
ncbi:hypothetical protein EPO44_14270 [bacterium]|nr:MAG: hypothetical protein EPO44_14270 [bacterium]